MFRSKFLFQALLLTSIAFSSCIAAEGQWSSLGTGFDSTVKAVQSYDNKLIVGGDFTTAGDGTAARGIAAWDGSSWSTLGSGLIGVYQSVEVNAMMIYDGKLVVAGVFDSAGGLPAPRIACWDGTEWTALEGYYLIARPSSLTIFKGDLTVTDKALWKRNHVWLWSGHDWSALPVWWDTTESDCPASISCTDYGYGSALGFGDTLFAVHWEFGGIFPLYYMEVWDGSSWSMMPEEPGYPHPLLFFNGSAGQPMAVFVRDASCGPFGCIFPIGKVAEWTGSTWSEIFTTNDAFQFASITAIAPYENGFVFGVTRGRLNSGLDDSAHVYVWDGQSTSPLGAGVDGRISAIGLWQNKIVVGGDFTLAGGEPSPHLALWTEEDKIDVALDVKPGSCRNPINANSRASQSNAVVPVAVMGTEEFDVNEIDPSTITLAGVAPVRHSIEDVGRPVDRSEDSCACNENGPDGYDDLTLKFQRSELVDALSGLPRSPETRVYLTGALYDSTAIEGYDCVELLHRQEGPQLTSVTSGLPAQFRVDAAYPNPFNPSTDISFYLPGAVDVKLEIFNILGQKVTTLIDRYLEAGEHSVTWDGSQVASGFYYYRLQAGENLATNKLLLLK